MKSCYFADLDPFGKKQVLHHGDQRDGAAEGDDETIDIDADALPQLGVVYCFFVVSSYSGSSFRTVKSAKCRVLSSADEKELASVIMSLEDRSATSMIVGRLRNNGGQWKFKEMSIPGKETCFANLCPVMQMCLRDVLPEGR